MRIDNKLHFWLPEHKYPPKPEAPWPFTHEEDRIGFKAFADYKRAFGGIMLPDDIHWSGMDAKDRKKWIDIGKASTNE